MATPEPTFLDAPTCWDCGAANDADAPRCWLCGRADWREAAPGAVQRWEGHAAKAPAPAATGGEDPLVIGPGPDRTRLNLASLMLVIALVAVMIGIAREAPGLAVMLGVAAVPALIITARRATLRRRQDRPMTAIEKVGVFVGSTLMSLMALILLAIAVGVALTVALLVICLSSGSGMFR